MKRIFIVLFALILMLDMIDMIYAYPGKSESVICEHPKNNGCEVQIGSGETFILTWEQFVRYMTKTNEVTLYGLGYRNDGKVEIHFTFN